MGRMTRRFFTQLVVGFTLALPIRVESRPVEPTTVARQECGPLSPLRQEWPPMDWDKFRIGLQIELGAGRG